MSLVIFCTQKASIGVAEVWRVASFVGVDEMGATVFCFDYFSTVFGFDVPMAIVGSVKVLADGVFGKQGRGVPIFVSG